MHVLGVNIFAVIVAALATTVLGFIWYSPMLFARPWCVAMGYNPDDKDAMDAMRKKSGDMIQSQCINGSKDNDENCERNLSTWWSFAWMTYRAHERCFVIQATHSLVPRLPPMSCVVIFCCTAARTAALIFAAASAKPRCSSIIAVVRIAPMGLAIFLPAKGGAEPCTGSNIEVRPG